jgi:hypothetical protein
MTSGRIFLNLEKVLKPNTILFAPIMSIFSMGFPSPAITFTVSPAARMELNKLETKLVIPPITG